MIRIPATRGQSTRTEIRCVDAAANPYLALAAILAAGLDGIKTTKDDETTKPVYDNIFSLSPEQREAQGIPNMCLVIGSLAIIGSVVFVVVTYQDSQKKTVKA